MSEMKHAMKLAIAAIMMTSAWARAGGDAWLTDFDKAKAKAAEKDVPILIDFTGSDWCGWCIKLDREVFSKEEFQTFAKDNVVLFMADFPRGKEQTDDVKQQNRKLAETYGIQGFPTILLVDAKGKVLARTGYRPGGAEVYVEHLKSLIEGGG